MNLRSIGDQSWPSLTEILCFRQCSGDSAIGEVLARSERSQEKRVQCSRLSSKEALQYVCKSQFSFDWQVFVTMTKFMFQAVQSRLLGDRWGRRKEVLASLAEAWSGKKPREESAVQSTQQQGSLAVCM